MQPIRWDCVSFVERVCGKLRVWFYVHVFIAAIWWWKGIEISEKAKKGDLKCKCNISQRSDRANAVNRQVETTTFKIYMIAIYFISDLMVIKIQNPS